MRTTLESQVFPSLRCLMGDWAYFVTSMTMADVAKWIKQTDQIHQSKQLRDMIQRELTDRVEDIVQYLLSQEQRFFNAIIVGVYGGDPEWYPVEVRDSVILGPPGLDERSKTSIGLLRLSGGEQLFAIDGQHRVEAIKQALEKKMELENEDLCVIFVPHRTDQSGLERTRRLFSTLNRYAKPVSKGEIVALDEDDTFAIVTRRLVEEYEPLSGDFVHFGKTTQIPSNNKRSITSILSLYDLVETIRLPLEKKKDVPRKTLTSHRQPPDEIDQIYKEHIVFWDALRKHAPELKKVTDSDPGKELAGNYRTSDGGHALFRPAGLKAFARAARILVDREMHLEEAVSLLCRTQLQLQKSPWIGVLWDLHGRRMIVRNELLAQNLFLHMVNQEPQKRNKLYSLLAELRRATGDERAILPQVRI